MSKITTVRATIAVLLCAAAAAGGCWAPGGPGYSGDQYCYESHSYQPWTVSIIDTRTGQTVFSMDVPVGRELVFKFYEERGDKVGVGERDPSPIYPDMMKWDLWPKGQRYGEPQKTLSVPAAEHRRIDSKLRKVPELPPEMTGETGAAEPTGNP
ncbi:MAG: hypothetical protein JNJ48_07330 [Phycisphaerae bacterium]|nr:hypothetical protein [Phycisphaerae bacterium]